MDALPIPAIPQHVAVVMDGNGRWATARHLPRVAGHNRGVDAVRKTVEVAGKRGVRYLTLFAFSSENWQRPADEVSTLMRLFVAALEREVDALEKNGVRLRVVGDLAAFAPRLRELIGEAERRTAGNDRLHLTVCAAYGGRWDIVQAARALVQRPADEVTEAEFARHLSLAFAPDCDLLIRTGGEQRISNFLLWQAAYAEIYFSEALWPDFDALDFDAALAWYATRERRFGRVRSRAAA
ncbi:MAG: polyprenyl diphosphate synthase [Betaproteobacteria bacterium]